MTVKNLPLETRLIQLAEECAECSQAALKLVRALRKETPVPEHEARVRLIEEIADVNVCMVALMEEDDLVTIEAIMRKKARRWEDRINGF